MRFIEDNLYHIYNRGNNKQSIFFSPDNYIYFLKQVRHFILPYCDILDYCLMPNHFHFLVSVKPLTEIKLKQTDIKEIKAGDKIYASATERHPLSTAIGHLLSTYTQAINKQNHTTGSLFQQKTKAKEINRFLYGTTCFHYIHQNPWKAGLVEKMEDWIFSSFNDYAGFRNGTLCNQELAYKLLNLNKDSFYKEAYMLLGEYEVNNIF
ncbi:MAG: transposase [Sphingobacteriales bacterium]|nr:transposase [Sphingobacteriales bacterium]MBI3720568.1 transposase [Sphingobacteriales bacterium]